MLNQKYVSSKVIIAKVYRDLRLKEEELYLDQIEWIAEALEAIGAYGQLLTKYQCLHVECCRAEIPCDFHSIIAVKHNGAPLHSTTNLFGPQNSNVATPNQFGLAIRNLPSLVNETFVDEVSDRYSQVKPTYELQGGWIKTSFSKGEIEIAYKAIPLDDDGFPLVPDEYSYKTACFWYIFKQLLLGGFPHPTIGYAIAEERWWMYCTQARANANMPDLDMTQNFVTSWFSLRPRVNQYSNFFENLNSPELM